MLVIKKDDVVSILLLNGAEVVGRFQEETDDVLKLKMPMIFIVQHGPQGQPVASMMPTMMSTLQDTLSFNKKAIIVGPVETAKNIKEGYMKETSPILLPN